MSHCLFQEAGVAVVLVLAAWWVDLPGDTTGVAREVIVADRGHLPDNRAHHRDNHHHILYCVINSPIARMVTTADSNIPAKTQDHNLKHLLEIALVQVLFWKGGGGCLIFFFIKVGSALDCRSTGLAIFLHLGYSLSKNSSHELRLPHPRIPL